MGSIIYIQTYHSPCGDLLLGEYGGRLCLCDWMGELSGEAVKGKRGGGAVQGRIGREVVDRRLRQELQADAKEQPTELLREAARQLDEYFRRERWTFDLPLLLVGSDFQKAVWQQLMQIPYGTTTSYGELARKLGDPQSVRAVATANGANALSIIVPCHRVLGRDGALTGYAGGLAAKRFLLDLESNMLFA